MLTLNSNDDNIIYIYIFIFIEYYIVYNQYLLELYFRNVTRLIYAPVENISNYMKKIERLVTTGGRLVH